MTPPAKYPTKELPYVSQFAGTIDESLEYHLKTMSRSATGTSKPVQNEITNIIGEHMLK